METTEIEKKVLNVMKGLTYDGIKLVDKKKIAAKLYQKYLKIEKGLLDDVQQDPAKS